MKTQIDSQNCQGCNEPEIYCNCKKQSHTPTPLERENYIKDYIAQFLMGTAKQTMEGDAYNYLVKAVNMHEEMLGIMKEIVKIVSSKNPVTVDNLFEIHEMAESIIAKAEGK